MALPKCRPACSVPWISGFDETGREISVYDPDRARELLAEAGVGNSRSYRSRL